MAAELKSYTIVPDTLYVERKADIQLHNIVEAMQRPGYVLVSRQMGKTNLLLRAKRKWENSDDLYVYIDMSNIDDAEKSCFEALIDTAIDTHEEQLGFLRKQIQELRMRSITKSPVQAHNEELRILLKAVKGKLVFILDEIDSLTRTSYSDNVFSQIRSTYFSRANYPVLEKLTYILSGVVEPTEIIKNPKISPFNIGEKIHLNDFTYDEYITFIKKADLEHLGTEVIEQIYFWAGGNPRITWDICYELQFKQNLTSTDVKTLVKEMYLTTYDKVPIDTIRNIVKEDRDLRDAIIQMAYDKGNSLSDKVKSKLYLAGIVNYSDDDVKIKNRIIKESLSLTWLQKVEEEEKGLISYAIELHAKGFYQESLNKFESYLRINDFPEDQAPYCYYYMGSCCYHLKEFERSLTYLTTKLIDPASSFNEYRHEHSLCGADCMNLGRYAESLEYFNKAMEGELRDKLYYSAKLNSLIARQRASQNSQEQLREIEEEYLDIIDKGIDDDDLKLYASFQLGGLYSTHDHERALYYYDQALSKADDLTRPRILVEKFYVVGEEQRSEIIDEILNTVSGLKEVSDTLDPEKNLELDETVFIKVLYLVYMYAYDRWSEIKDKIALLNASYGDVLFRMFLKLSVASDLWSEGSYRLITELHDNIHSVEYGITEGTALYIYEYYAFLVYSAESAKEYIIRLKESDSQIDGIGLTVVRSYALSLLEGQKYKQISKDLEWITERYPERFSHQETIARALFEYSLLQSYYANHDYKSMREMANMILTYIDDEIKTGNDRSKDMLKQVKESSEQALSLFALHKPVIHTMKYGRNDRVKVRYIATDIIVEKKYKQVEEDITEGKCVIIV